MNPSERLWRRRCFGLRVGVLFAVVLCVLYRGDWAVVGVLAAGGLVAIVVYWRDCRGSAPRSAQTDTHTPDEER